jgi:hypothetical protein
MIGSKFLGIYLLNRSLRAYNFTFVPRSLADIDIIYGTSSFFFRFPLVA